jgi:hypothetical protein
MNIQKRLDKLNKEIFLAMSFHDTNTACESKKVVKILNQMREEGYSIMMGNNESNYTIGELRVIEKLLAWITQIMYANTLKIKEIELMADEADPEIYDQQIKDAVDGLKTYRGLHPDGIAFFKIHNNAILLKSSPYFIFEEIIMYKIGMVIPGKSELGDFHFL